MATETLHLKIDANSIADIRKIAEDAGRKQCELHRLIFELGLKAYRKQYAELKKLKELNGITI